MNIKNIKYSCADDFYQLPGTKSSSFADWDFIQTLSRATGYRNISVTLETDYKKYILPLLERKFWSLYPLAFSLPLGLYGGFAVTAEHYKALLPRIKTFLNRSIVLQNPFDPALNTAHLPSLLRTSTHVIELQNFSYEEVFKTFFDAKLRNQIRKAEKSNLAVQEGNDEKIINLFYELYVMTNRRWGKSNPRYGINFFNAFAGKPFFEIKLALHAGQAAAAIVLLKLSGHYLYWFGALNKDYSEYCPNHLLISRTIKEAAGNGTGLFNFGASEKLSAVRKFKESFGAKEVSYDIYFLGNPLTKYALTNYLRRQ